MLLDIDPLTAHGFVKLDNMHDYVQSITVHFQNSLFYLLTHQLGYV